jgi:cysteine desulfurase
LVGDYVLRSRLLRGLYPGASFEVRQRWLGITFYARFCCGACTRVWDGRCGLYAVGMARTWVYLDHAATTPMLPAATQSLVDTLTNAFGNPSGSHGESRKARTALDDARDRLAAVIGAQAREIVFTSGGTEALNLALGGASGTGALAWSAVEHDAVRNTVEALIRRGRDAIELPVDNNGVLDLVALELLLHNGVSAVAVMAVNNEVGALQPIVEIAEIVRRRSPAAVFIVDAVQALTWIDLRPIVAVADLVAMSAHKFGGPKGVGALIVREGTVIEPTVFGGGQERDRRSGTQNVSGAVAMAVAAEIADRDRVVVTNRVEALRNRLVDGLVTTVSGLVETSDRATKVPGNAHVCIEDVESEELLVLLDQGGVCASAGSACASGAVHASPVLLAMGIPKERALGSLRLTLGTTTTDADVDHALRVIPEAVVRLRS